MSSFAPRVAGSPDTRPDPNKHVNYSLGMVLGEDDFKQEFAYLSGRDQWAARDLVGYGTVDGLAVSVAYDADARAEVRVTPGVAISPRGQLIRVMPTQCADLGGWLAQERNRARLAKLPPTTTILPLYVVLSYRECATDQVPIPGEPCRSEEDSMEASRLADNFRLGLSFDPPAPGEEEALRDFVAWLSKTVVVGDESAGTFADLEQFLTAVRRAAEVPSPPPAPPDFMHGTPPPGLRVRSSDACEFLRAALRVWVTELRPLWGGAGGGPGEPPNEEGVLLAELSVPLRRSAAGDRWELEHPGFARAAVLEERRPFVLHLRMLQEWVECGSTLPTPGDNVVEETTFGRPPAPGTSAAYSRADHTHGTPPLVGDVTVGGDGRTIVERVNGIPVVPSANVPPEDNQVLLYTGDRWVGADAPPLHLEGDVTGSTDDNELSALKGVPFLYNEATAREGQVLTYALIDTGEGVDTPPPDSPPAAPTLRPAWIPADLTLQGATVRQPDEAAPLQNGQVLTYVRPGSPPGPGRWEAAPLPDVALGGDVAGPAETNRVDKLRGIPLADFAAVKPQNGELLTYVIPEKQTEGTWSSKPPANLAGDVTGPPAATTITALRGTPVADFTQAAEQPAAGSVLVYASEGSPPAALWRARAQGGDVVGSPTDSTVSRIRRVPVGARGDAAPFINGDVLVFRNGTWTPEPLPQSSGGATTSGSFVERPAGQPTYSIVAAGIIPGRAPLYGGLHVIDMGEGTIIFSFNGYTQPDGKFQYVVKALPVVPTKLVELYGVVVTCEGFTAKGVALLVTSQGGAVPQELVEQLEFMIEVSRFEGVTRAETE